MRALLLWVAVLSIGGLLFLTVDVAMRSGVTPLVALSVLVLGLFLFGIVGALLHPPEE
jgi:hypothetical protein